MTEQQIEMWNVLSELGGEEVLRVLTDWHGLQLLNDGFHEHLIDEGYIEDPEEEEEEANCEGYIEDPEEEEEEANCEAVTYNCDTCSLDGMCVLQGTEELKRAKQAETFEDFCGSFNGCTYCPFDGELEDCERDLWPKWKEDHLC